MAPAKKKQKLSEDSMADSEMRDDVEFQAITTPSAQDGKGEQQRRSLFVRSLPASTTSESLTELFSKSYPIKHATAVVDPATTECRGYGFVTFADAETAERASKEFNGYVLDGRKLRAEIAEPRKRDPQHVHVDGSAKGEQTKRPQDVPQPSRLIVRNLPWTIKTSDQLAKLFMKFGKVKQAYIPKTTHGRMAGFGFVVLRGRKNAEKALEEINGKEIGGRTLAVDWAVSKDVYENVLNREADQLQDEENRKEAGRPGDEHQTNENGEDDGQNGPTAGSDVMDVDSAQDEVEDLEDNDGDDVQMVLDESNVDLSEDRSATLFIRNIPFTCTDDDLEDHFSTFGSTRYARVVMDAGTERSKGTAFVCFYNKSDADDCLRGAPRQSTQSAAKDEKGVRATTSILQNEEADPTGQYTMDGRVLQVSRAVDKSEANRLTQESATQRYKRNEDKRRTYLLSEGSISSRSKLWESLSPSERHMREASVKQRKSLIESNPSLHLSFTRLSIRNIPRSIGSQELKALAREAVVGFATDVKSGLREKLSKEELARGGEDMQAAEEARKKSGKGVVKQAKVVFEGAGGSKVSEGSGAGTSRGYGFIEYHTHRCALMGLRWLNGHAITYRVKEDSKLKPKWEEPQDRKKRLIVEFAIENAQVVMRRKDREQKARDRSEAVQRGEITADPVTGDSTTHTSASRKRKRGPERPSDPRTRRKGRGADAPRIPTGGPKPQPKKPIDEKLARRNQIIGRKRARRQTRKGTKP